ncbi:alanine:cation symporter family protein [Clostridium bornimense]|uniref:alanine/glycine:cation symporter family protein n=1 Tax=Clostridium bornimense TaxID=1216932 RepID=UPI001C0FE28E|nr:alanine/glycine:cation symporter family protein [Clostridium bornimense]MBU5316637.1 alanine:cation symporter family protein [Clostridium bornimense]
MEKFLDKIDGSISTYVMVPLLIIVGLIFTFRTKFVQVIHFKDMIKLLTEGTSKDDKDGISSFQAFCMSTASRVGTGNLAGVALAISIGGAGAIFWMWLLAIIGGASSFIESTLAQIYKVKDGDTYRGGPSYYIQQGLNQRWLGIVFAILITITFGLVFNSAQSNTISEALITVFNNDSIKPIYIGIILAIITALIIFGGVKRIAKVSGVIVPIMAVLYIGIAFVVIILNIKEIPAVISLIFRNAFGFEEIVGGTFGGMVMIGIKRGLFSNEAGMGSAPNAAATAEVSHPVKQGLIQTLGVFTDTILICTCTAMIILLSDVYTVGEVSGIALTQKALSSHIGGFGNIFIAVCIFFFAFSSIIGNYYYGETNLEFINTSKTLLIVYRVFVVVMVILGTIAPLGVVWAASNIFMSLMALINLLVILLLGKKALDALEDYRKQKREGKNPVFTKKSIEGIENVECWDK